VSRPPLAEALDLEPHPEGGWFRETWRSAVRFEPPGYGGERSAASAIYYLLAPGDESRWHTVRSDELWLWHRGGALELLLGGDGERPLEVPQRVFLGPEPAAGQAPQALVPALTWQAARPAGTEEVLVTCVVAPGFEFADFRLG
jgi:predicted cupin superfamily sugar epimerase